MLVNFLMTVIMKSGWVCKGFNHCFKVTQNRELLEVLDFIAQQQHLKMVPADEMICSL